LRLWRKDSGLRFHSRSIIVVETAPAPGVKRKSRAASTEPDVALVPFADRRCLIVVNSTVVRNVPGVDILPLGRTRAFLALPVGRVVTDLELAVIDRMSEPIDGRERRALVFLREQLRLWRREATVTFHARTIIVVESSTRRGSRARVRATALNHRQAMPAR
jgi:hypothetical protein